MSTCPDGQYADSGNICTQCSTTCKTCTTSAFTCTSCSNSTFLNDNTKICVDSLSCPFGTYPYTSTNKCETCDLSCSGCTGSTKNCNSCATGYLQDFTNGTFKNCTNQCPTGTVNDTINNLGCRCDIQCKTCQGTTSSCLTCDTST